MSALGSRIFTSAPFGPGVSMQNLAEWSSLAHVQLLGRVAAGLGVDIDIEEAYRLDSFERLLQYIERQRWPGGGAPAASATSSAASRRAAASCSRRSAGSISRRSRRKSAAKRGTRAS
ncbi:acyl carrier protein [Burkholderia humptydooensis]|uniref:Acyl carrier protein n=2 Tax=Burkholderia humptydooensis TaxID=430531 RepID=A0A7U4SUR2_9BURK|nr:AMP-binding protein [Burkholderia humptydooensis]EIP85147.1 AMP-binding domain protein [Burkholderia humptydooensis MSMB43]QPS48027.1 acyl carrier protein [Burkholderia humptydooensis]